MTVCTAGYHDGMRQLLVSVEEQDWERLQQVAQRANCTAEELIARILRHLLQRVNPPTQEWQQRFDTLLQQVHEHTKQFSPEEIEADITDAWREYRSECGS